MQDDTSMTEYQKKIFLLAIRTSLYKTKLILKEIKEHEKLFGAINQNS